MWFLQTRNGKRTGAAMVKIAMDLLRQGMIDEKTARKRRRELQQEADFYGSMDGASKFVKGDAIAGIIVTVVNIFAGIIMGVIVPHI